MMAVTAMRSVITKLIILVFLAAICLWACTPFALLVSALQPLGRPADPTPAAATGPVNLWPTPRPTPDF